MDIFQVLVEHLSRSAFLIKSNTDLDIDHSLELIDSGKLSKDQLYSVASSIVSKDPNSLVHLKDRLDANAFNSLGVSAIHNLIDKRQNVSIKLWSSLLPKSVVEGAIKKALDFDIDNVFFISDISENYSRSRSLAHFGLSTGEIEHPVIVRLLGQDKLLDKINSFIFEDCDFISYLIKKNLVPFDNIKIRAFEEIQRKPELVKEYQNASNLFLRKEIDDFLSERFDERNTGNRIKLEEYEDHGERTRGVSKLPYGATALSPKSIDKIEEYHAISVPRDIYQALRHYTSDSYSLGHLAINKALKFDGKVGEEVSGIISSIDKAMGMSYLKTDLILWRGLASQSATNSLVRKIRSMNSRKNADKQLNSLKGFTFKDLAYVSTSLNRKAVVGFESSGILLRIKAPIGTPAVFLNSVKSEDRGIASTYPEESEVLLDRGLSFRVENVISTSGKRGPLDTRTYIITLEIV